MKSPKVTIAMHMLKNNLIRTLLTYLLLIAAAVSMHFYFLEADVSFNENCCDSFRQISHFYPYLQDEFSEGNFFWSWSNGLGGDLFGGLSYYYTTSPLFWLITLLFPDMETMKEVFESRIYISIGKLFLAMVFMYHLLRSMKLLRVSSIISALIYGGSVFFMFNSLRYDFMVDGMVYLPLLIWSFEHSIDKKRPLVFIAATAVIVCANFYLAFINSLFLGLYAIHKYFLTEQRSVSSFVKYMMRFMAAYFAGMLLAAFAFLPAVYSFLNVDRFYYEAPIPLLFSMDFYKMLFYQLFFMGSSTVDFLVVFPVLVYLLLPLGFFLADKMDKQRFRFAFLFSLLVLIPFSYSLFNGLSAIQYRWLYLFIFVVAWISGFIIDSILKRKMKKQVLLAVPALLILLAAMLLMKEEVIGKIVSKGDLLVFGLAAAFAALLILWRAAKNKKAEFAISTLLVLGLLFNAVYMNTEMLQRFLGDPELLKEQQEEMLQNYATADEQEMIDNIQNRDPGFYRIMWNFLKEPNAPMFFGYKGFSAYSSLMSGNIHQFMKNDYNVLHWNSPSLFQNLDNRLYLETALANKYYIRPHNTVFKPYGYTLIDSNDSYEIYENDHFLPIGFLYEEIVSRSEFEKLSFAERDQLLLQAAVVDEESAISLPSYDTDKLSVEKKEFTFSDMSFTNASVNEDGIITAGKDASIQVANPWAYEQGEVMLELKIRETLKRSFKVTSAFKVFTDNGEGAVYNYPREKITINAGHQLDNDKFSIALSPGSYQLDNLLLTFNPYRNYPEMVESRKAKSLEDITFTGNSVSGTIEAEKESLLFMSVPFSKGWKAQVDGEEVQPIEINSAFVGIPLTPGTHQIEIKYTTPYFMLGTFISIFAAAAILLLQLAKRSRKKKKDDWI